MEGQKKQERKKKEGKKEREREDNKLNEMKKMRVTFSLQGKEHFKNTCQVLK